MYATQAIGLNGGRVRLTATCQGDGRPGSSCGLPLYFSHDETKSSGTTHRYASCMSRHTWSFVCGPSYEPIEVLEPGVLIDDSDPANPRGPSKTFVSIHSETDDLFLEEAALFQKVVGSSGRDPSTIHIYHEPAATRMTRRSREAAAKRRKNPKKKHK